MNLGSLEHCLALMIISVLALSHFRARLNCSNLFSPLIRLAMSLNTKCFRKSLEKVDETRLVVVIFFTLPLLFSSCLLCVGTL